jgi:hypothetical protein
MRGWAQPLAAAALAAARALGLPGGVLWLLFSQGATHPGATPGGRRIPGPTDPASIAPAGAPGPPASGRRFAVGFSFAGEDRAVVAPIAERLAERLSQARVLYDQFHEAELARVDLDVYLPRLYRDACELIVVVLSPDYPQKRWCGLEWRWIRQLILGETRERIMLLQTGQPGDLSELGILSGDGYLDISQRPAKAVAEKILERMVQQGIVQQGIALDSPSEAGGALGLLPRAAAIGAVGLALLAGGVWMGGPLLARWHLDQGDQAFLAFAKLGDEGQIQRAGQAWQRAKDLDPQQPEAHARLGFLADILDNRPATATWLGCPKESPGGSAKAGSA